MLEEDDEELEEFGIMEGATGSKKDKKHWFICPRYWCTLTNLPMTEKQVKDGEPVAVETTDGGMVTVNLWKSSFKAGTITLGGNGEGSAGAGSNYFVILTGQSTGASVDAKSKLSTTWANIKSN